jgi:hypothetical protein
METLLLHSIASSIVSWLFRFLTGNLTLAKTIKVAVLAASTAATKRLGVN